MATLLERFWNKVAITPDHWIWIGAYFKSGYGSLYQDGKNRRAHIVSWEQFVGPVPFGHGVLHKCDVIQCVWPEHLFTGTQAQNMRDMVAKGRSNSGSDRPLSILTEEDVVKIRQYLAQGLPQQTIAEMFGISRSQISAINTRKQWRNA